MRRIPSVSERYSNGHHSFLESSAMKICLNMIGRFSRKDMGSNESLHFGYHIHAVKRDKYKNLLNLHISDITLIMENQRMSKILLVDPPWYLFQNIKTDSVPLGVTYIATVLKENNHNCLIYNGDFTTDYLTGHEGVLIDYKNYINEITHKTSPVWLDFKNLLNGFKPDYVGISILTPKYGTAIELAKIVKSYSSNIPIFVGGLHPTLQPVETLKESCFDIVVMGEGEKTVVELIKALDSNKNLSSIKGIYYKENGNILKNSPRPLIEDIDAIPFPDFTLLHRFEEYPPDYLNRILTSRGCPFNCIYCASKMLWGRRVRFRDPEKVFEEIKYRYDKFGVRFFKFNDDTFTLNSQRLGKLCGLIIKDEMDIEWMCDTRADKLNEEMLKIMKNAGCCQVNIGVESGSEKILSFIQKGESLETIRKAFFLTKKFKITTLAYFMMGFPYEIKEDTIQSINIMRELNPDIVCWSLFTPYPGTEIYNNLIDAGLLAKAPDWSRFFHHSPDMYFSKNFSEQEWLELIELVNNAINDYHREAKIKKNIRNPIHLLLKRMPMYKKKPSLIWNDFSFVHDLYKYVLKK